jgi:hypothetical protein
MSKSTGLGGAIAVLRLDQSPMVAVRTVIEINYIFFDYNC